jgi:hypothetical protein
MDKSLHRKSIFSFLILFALSFHSYAQRSFWQQVRPDEATLQYAGSIGFLSAGAGYDLFNEKAALSLHVGYVPESLGGELAILSAKFHYKPWKIKIKDKFVIYPFNPVFFPSYTLGKNFDLKFEKPQYREGYYFWSSALRLHLGASAEVKIMQMPGAKLKSFSIFAETNTNDLYALSWFKNRTSSPLYGIFRLGYGVKIGF